MNASLDRYLTIILVLIAIYLIVRNRDGFDGAIRGLGAFNIATIAGFQGKCVNAFGVRLDCVPQGTTDYPRITF